MVRPLRRRGRTHVRTPVPRTARGRRAAVRRRPSRRRPLSSGSGSRSRRPPRRCRPDGAPRPPARPGAAPAPLHEHRDGVVVGQGEHACACLVGHQDGVAGTVGETVGPRARGQRDLGPAGAGGVVDADQPGRPGSATRIRCCGIDEHGARRHEVARCRAPGHARLSEGRPRRPPTDMLPVTTRRLPVSATTSRSASTATPRGPRSGPTAAGGRRHKHPPESRSMPTTRSLPASATSRRGGSACTAYGAENGPAAASAWSRDHGSWASRGLERDDAGASLVGEVEHSASRGPAGTTDRPPGQEERVRPRPDT